jgi:YaiO family outer membrane protein
MSTIRHTIITAMLLGPLCATAQHYDTARTQSVTATYEYNKFRQATSYHWQQGSIEYKKQTPGIALIGRFNYAQRTVRTGWQGEVEAYPQLSKKVYAFTSLSYSGSETVFPRWRSGLSLYVALPAAWELEGGVRYLRFDRDIWILAPGLARYMGNWYLQARSFISLNSPTGIDQSYFFTGRYYLPSGVDYVWLQAGTGISPDESRAAQLQVPSLHRQVAAGGIRTTIAGRHILLGTLGYARNEFRKGSYGSQITALAGYGLKF